MLCRQVAVIHSYLYIYSYIYEYFCILTLKLFQALTGLLKNLLLALLGLTDILEIIYVNSSSKKKKPVFLHRLPSLR